MFGTKLKFVLFYVYERLQSHASEGADGKGSQTIDTIGPMTRLKLSAQSTRRKLL
jgi:uncharacterized membrane protein